MLGIDRTDAEVGDGLHSSNLTFSRLIVNYRQSGEKVQHNVHTRADGTERASRAVGSASRAALTIHRSTASASGGARRASLRRSVIAPQNLEWLWPGCCLRAMRG
ncbi:MAG: hypothetical protein BroJett026_40440 [Betaproteobacteria bacterium]|nr:MAG: hypothetical protein BroJett026_40440 [Betaproteobacteria bacterium]